MLKKTKNLDPLNQAIKDSLQACKKPLILAHIRPDGDAVGSIVALGSGLRQLEKDPILVLSDGLPKRYRFLDGCETITTSLTEPYDLVITVDCANRERLSTPDELEEVHVNIDHHVTNEQYANHNLIKPQLASTTAILAKHMPMWGISITKKIANALMMGMITDTIGFRTNNVTPEFLRLAGDLLEEGAQLADMYHKGLTLHSVKASKIWGFALSRLETDQHLAWTSILVDDRKKAEYESRDDADLTNHLSSIENIDISILFNEQKDGKVKVSWRSSEQYDVTQIAALYGGGGHPQASGATLTGTLDAVKQRVIGETKKLLEGK